jgi:hypothetical protein
MRQQKGAVALNDAQQKQFGITARLHRDAFQLTCPMNKSVM